ncbi:MULTISPECIES: flagellar hook-associated protein FlgK [Rahnella]|jgi:flagellar hook-associated protein 1 FlgK|uniref:Flagellar hook-associated protein 1 n=1 Tax=Rahnella sp. (strain Y9602) TaxID=2703885 RepID=A0A0H3FBG6_RAHSY|nr:MULTISPECIES: flagellar hook-associated protein FlgK [Rahnella]AFE58054.1 flagellar hook-associated protein FlgK [Rahnella aquatilis HX2]AYA06672.1 flagellar hook-associated protein FlgK [Rahnella aquatilis]ADW73470.1 flagellar hook-associated protein FlgK [Rahnella aceris]AZP50729.1 flagellar hook-associated protein FlgK [Rahnella aquatilis]MBU9841727.1 flagellar hook-associated protein FlgK [Rahnella aceris]
MSSSLINTAMSGLNAAQAALSTTGNNIANVSVAGYNRQTAIITQSNGISTPAGYIGNGVTVTGVNREYNSFVVKQLLGASATGSALSTQLDQASSIDDLLGDSSTGIDATMSTFFKGLQTLTSNASDSAARQAVLGEAQGLTAQFNSSAKYLNDMNTAVNQQVTQNVDQINTYASQIAKLNSQITATRGSTGQEPNALLDQRDQLVSQLNNVTGVVVTQQDGDTYNISFANGTPLVSGGNAKTVVAMPSSADPSKLTVGMTQPDGSVSEIQESRLTTGSLGGTLAFRKDNLEPAINQLGQLALALSDSFNTTNKAGFDLNGDAGTDFFSFTGATTVSNTKNTGSAQLSVAYTDTAAVKASDYTMAYNGTSWDVTRVSDGAKITPTAGTDSNGDPTMNFDGLSVSVTGTPNTNDSITIKTVSNVAGSMNLAISDSSLIAAAGAADSGVSDNTNAQKLLNLQTAKLVEGKSTLSGAYASMVSNVGNQVSTLTTTSTSQANIVTQLTAQQQSISGVNLDEEYGDLQRYQQYYLANAQVVQTASTIFDAIINIR